MPLRLLCHCRPHFHFATLSLQRVRPRHALHSCGHSPTRNPVLDAWSLLYQVVFLFPIYVISHTVDVYGFMAPVTLAHIAAHFLLALPVSECSTLKSLSFDNDKLDSTGTQLLLRQLSPAGKHSLLKHDERWHMHPPWALPVKVSWQHAHTRLCHTVCCTSHMHASAGVKSVHNI